MREVNSSEHFGSCVSETSLDLDDGGVYTGKCSAPTGGHQNELL